LLSSYVLLSSLLQDLQEIKNTKEEEVKQLAQTILRRRNYPKNYTQELLFSYTGEYWAFIGKTSGTGGPYWSIQGHHGRVFAAMLRPLAQRRSVGLVPAVRFA